jgi:hypothetical protein
LGKEAYVSVGYLGLGQDGTELMLLSLVCICGPFIMSYACVVFGRLVNRSSFGFSLFFMATVVAFLFLSSLLSYNFLIRGARSVIMKAWPAFGGKKSVGFY